MLSICYANAEENYDDLVEVSIISNEKQIQRGSDFYVAIKLKIADDWHVYWKNPGDSGLPTEVKWNTPKGVEAVGGLIWQIPEKIKWEGMINYGYSEQMYLIQKFKTTRISDKPTLDIEAEVKWLVCKEKCIPQEDKVSIKLDVGEKFIKSVYDETIKDLLAKAPVKFDSKKSNFEYDEDDVTLNIVEIPKDLEKVNDILFITDGIVNNTANYEIEKDDEGIEAEFQLSPYMDVMPAELEVLVLYTDNKGNKKSYETIISN